VLFLSVVSRTIGFISLRARSSFLLSNEKYGHQDADENEPRSYQ